MYRTVFKRAFDILFSSIGFIILLPITIVVFILLFIENNGKPFYTQERPGKDNKVFLLLKFKTMNDKKDLNGNLLPDKLRITKLGSIVRKTSLDEIPQLINVIKGEMSLIGPRPLRTFYLPYYTEEEKKRHDVRPGITGLAQISGRNFLNWEQRFAYDLEYVSNVSAMLDFKIAYKTLLKVIKSSDIAEDPNEFVENFDVYRQRQIDNAC